MSTVPTVAASQRIAAFLPANQQAITEEVKRQANLVTDDQLWQAQLVNEFANVVGELHKGAPRDAVMDTPRQAMASVVQSFVSQKAAEASQVQMADDVPVVKFSDHDLLEWIKTGFVGHSEGQDKFPFRTAPDDPDPLSNTSRHLRVAIFGDWSTGAYGATVITDSIHNDQDGFEVVLHLADMYYSGQPGKVESQLVAACPYRSDALNRSLNGNHEMSSGRNVWRVAHLQKWAGNTRQQVLDCDRSCSNGIHKSSSS